MSEQNDVEKHGNILKLVIEVPVELNILNNILVKDYDLHDKDGKKINGASLKLSYGFGIHYQVI